MEERINRILIEADTVYKDAELLLENERYESSVNRSYYSVFHSAQALLHSKNIFAKTHSGTRRKFSEIFIKSELLPLECNEWFIKLESSRMISDYSYDNEVSPKIAKLAIEYAQKFIAQTKSYFENLEKDSTETDKRE
ncbi:MAG: HEPN domain-containing protein [Bacteroidota bacterium]